MASALEANKVQTGRKPGLTMNEPPFINKPYGSTSANGDGCVLRSDAETQGPQKISADADARAPFSMQPGLRRMRQNPIPGARFKPAPHSGAMLGRGGRMRYSDGGDPGRRTTDPP